MNKEPYKTAEEILLEYIEFDDANGSETVELLPLTIIDAMTEYAQQLRNCDCSSDETTGWTTVKCCNICGRPIKGESWSSVISIDKLRECADDIWEMIPEDARKLMNPVAGEFIYAVMEAIQNMCGNNKLNKK